MNAHTLEPCLEPKFAMRQPRTKVTAIYLKQTSKVMVFGGNLKDEVRTDLIEVLDLKKGSWKMCPKSLPGRMSGMSSILTNSTTIFLVGGNDGKTSS